MTKLEVLIIGMAIGWIGAIIFAVLLSESVPEPLPAAPMHRQKLSLEESLLFLMGCVGPLLYVLLILGGLVAGVILLWKLALK
jgi:hypothetical protein